MSLTPVPQQPGAPAARRSLFGRSPPELRALALDWGEPRFRGDQIARWLYQELVFEPREMLDLPRRLRERLVDETDRFPLVPIAERTADAGLTQKTLFRMSDGNQIESVLMRYPEMRSGHSRRTVCISSQVGCAIGCPFCATGLLGLRRQLSIGEILAQVLYFARQVRAVEGPDARITNVVLMGEGEPMANFKNVWPAIELLNDPNGFALGARRVTISTSGLVPRILELATLPLQVGLAVSLHAPSDELRDRLVPVNRKYPIAEVLAACRTYAEATHRRVSFEYAMMAGINDSLRQAAELARLLRGRLAHVNLIPLNEVEGSPFHPTSWSGILGFQKVLHDAGVFCTIRSTRGDDIDGACGQLHAQFSESPPLASPGQSESTLLR